MSHLRRLFAVVALALVVAPLVASAPLFDPDEGLHAAIAQEMVQRGDYVTPTFRGEPFLDKPILFFWAEAASLRLVGHNAAAVRLPPLLFGLFGMIAVALLGRALFDEAAGLIAGIAYGTMLLPMGVSEVAVHDIGLVPFMCLAALCLVRLENNLVASAFRRKILFYGFAAGFVLGLSILTKGLVGIVFTGILAVCLTVRRPESWLRLGVTLTIAVVVALLVAAPWYIAMEHAHPGYLYYYFVERHLQGYLTATQRHAGRPFWYYVPIVIGGALPWTGYLAGAVRSALGGAPGSPEIWLRRTLWGWFAVGLVFLSIGESKLVTYALPLFPILALIVGEHLATRSSRGFGYIIHVAALALLPALGLVALKVKFGEARPFLWTAVLLLGLAVVLIGRHARRSPSADALIDGIARMSVLALLGLMLVAPRAAAWMTGRDLAATFNAAGALPSRVWIIDERIGSLIFYLDPPLRAQAGTDRVDVSSFPEAVTHARVDPDDTIFAVRDNQLPRFNRMFASPPAPDTRAGTFSLFRAETLRKSY
ncbi:MAG TPA: glycosyltransferase family 39 protein [Vicinamibacterales bacterium]|nr:glycosyltransferase family 39 protein [Vicinamibacterales bacterium]